MPLSWTKETGGIGNVDGSIQSSPVVAQQILAINDVLPFSVKAKAASTTDLTRWLDANGNIVARVTYLGELVTSDATFVLANTGLKIRDTDASNTLTIKPGSNLTSDRIFTFITGDSDRSLTLSGNPTLADWFDQSVKTTASPTHVVLTLSQATGTAPMIISSTTVVTNLNADLVDGIHGTALVQTTRTVSTTSPLAGGGALSGDLTLSLGGLTTIGAGNQTVGTNAAGTGWEYKTIVGTANEIDIVNTPNQIQIGIVNPLSVPKGGTGLPATIANQLLYSSANDVIAGLVTGNSGVLVTSGAGVPSISTDIPTAVTIGGGYIYRVGGSDVGLADGGTNAGLTASNGGIVYSTATQLAILPGTATANQIPLSGSSAAPSWSTATYPATTTINRILYSSAANTISEIVSGNSGVLITSGAGVPSISTDIPTAVTIGGGYIYRASGTDVALLDGGTNASLVASNGGIVYSTATAMAVLSGTATASQILLSGSSAAPSWSTATYPATTTINQLLYSSAANVIAGVPTGNNGVLITSGTGIPSISSTIPTATQDNITRLGTIASGVWQGTTIGVAYGGTGITSTTINRILYSSANNTIAEITTGNNGVLITSGTGVPSISSTIPAATQANITALGTITSGVWNGTVLGVAYGGSGVATLTLNGVLYGNAATSILATAQGGADTVLTANAGAPSFSGQPSLATGIITKGQNAHQINPYGAAAGNTGEIRFLELAANGTSYVGFKAQDSLAGNVIWQLPLVDGSAGQFLKTSGAGVLSFDTVGVTGFSSNCLVYRATTQNIPDVTDTKIQFASETFDTSNEFDSTTNYRFTATNAGKYVILANILCDPVSSAFIFRALLYKNGSTVQYNGLETSAVGAAQTNWIKMIVSLAANDYIEIFAYTARGTSVDILGHATSGYTTLSVHRLS